MKYLAYLQLAVMLGVLAVLTQQSMELDSMRNDSAHLWDESASQDDWLRQHNQSLIANTDSLCRLNQDSIEQWKALIEQRNALLAGLPILPGVRTDLWSDVDYVLLPDSAATVALRVRLN